MNWYKQANKDPWLKFLSYNDTYNELSVAFKGIPYTYSQVSPFHAKKIRSLIYNNNFSSAVKMLKNFPSTQENLQTMQTVQKMDPGNYDPAPTGEQRLMPFMEKDKVQHNPREHGGLLSPTHKEPNAL